MTKHRHGATVVSNVIKAMEIYCQIEVAKTRKHFALWEQILDSRQRKVLSKRMSQNLQCDIHIENLDYL